MTSLHSSMANCADCHDGATQPFPFTMAFQPIVDIQTGRVYAYEALVRGLNDESAQSILEQVNPENRSAFDQGCRVAAITLAKRLGLDRTGAKLSINFMPSAVHSMACIQLTLKIARETGFPQNLLIFEITETEEVKDKTHLSAIYEEYRRQGFQMAMDDFGAGFCGLNLFTELPPDILKLDMALTRDLAQRPVALATIRCMVQLCETLKIPLVAEGVETLEEYETLRACGIRLMQGYLLGRPALEALPDVTQPYARKPPASVKRVAVHRAA